MKSIVLAAVAATFATSAFAGEAMVRDHFKTVIEQTPHSVEVCRDVMVETTKPGVSIEGAILGGIIGNNIGDSKGNGAAGAILGGLLGGSKKETHIERQCSTETRYTEREVSVYSHSTVTFVDGGREYTLNFTK